MLHRQTCFLVITAYLLVDITVISAANRTWTGLGADTNWSTGANWDTGFPLPSDTLTFDGVTRLNNCNDLASDTQITGVTFNNSAGSFVMNGNAISLNGNITDNSPNLQSINLWLDLTNNTTITVSNNAGTLSINGEITTLGSFSLSKNGTGTLSLSGVGSQVTNGVNVNAGTLLITGGSITTTTFTVSPSGVVTQSAGTVNLTSGWYINSGATGVYYITGGSFVCTNGFWRGSSLNASGNALVTILSTTSGPRVATDGKTGSLTLGGNAVVTFLQTLQLMSPGATASTGTINLAGGRLIVPSLDMSVYSTSNSWTVVNFAGGILQFSSSTTLSPAVSNSSFNVFSGGACIDTTNNNVTIRQDFQDGGGNGGLLKMGSGTLVLSNTNTFTGITIISNGTLVLNSDLALQNSTFCCTNTGGTLILTNTLTAYSFGGLSGDRNFGLTNIAGTALTLTLGGSNDAIYSGALSGPGNIIKTGSGMQEFDGTNTYIGPTVVSNGLLVINGSLAAGSSVTVTNTGGLGGSGVVNGPVNISTGCRLSPGGTNTTGMLTISNDCNITGGSLVYDWQYDGVAVTGDLVNVKGNLTLPPSATLNVTRIGGSMPIFGTLFSYSGTCSISDFSGWTVNGLNGSSLMLRNDRAGKRIILERAGTVLRVR